MLQDRVPPFPAEQAIEIIEKAYGKSVAMMFSRASMTEPFAAASIAQVHTAALQDGTEVIVKVLRPGVRQLIEQRPRRPVRDCRPCRQILGARQATAAAGDRRRVREDHNQ